MTQAERLYEILRDGKWHTNRELNAVCYRYGARLHEMRSSFEIETRKAKRKKGGPNVNGLYEYRLVRRLR